MSRNSPVFVVLKGNKDVDFNMFDVLSTLFSFHIKQYLYILSFCLYSDEHSSQFLHNYKSSFLAFLFLPSLLYPFNSSVDSAAKYFKKSLTSRPPW